MGHGFAVAGCGTSAAGAAAARARLSRVAPGFGKQAGAATLLRPVDVAPAETVDAWAADVLAELGAPDLVIANAGVVNAPAPIWWSSSPASCRPRSP